MRKTIHTIYLPDSTEKALIREFEGGCMGMSIDDFFTFLFTYGLFQYCEVKEHMSADNLYELKTGAEVIPFPRRA